MWTHLNPHLDDIGKKNIRFQIKQFQINQFHLQPSSKCGNLFADARKVVIDNFSSMTFSWKKLQGQGYKVKIYCIMRKFLSKGNHM